MQINVNLLSFVIHFQSKNIILINLYNGCNKN
jgi:hypothetical protein